jgi:hypothetical protein
MGPDSFVYARNTCYLSVAIAMGERYTLPPLLRRLLCVLFPPS